VGAGWNEEESGAYGIPLGSPRQRSDRFEEACQVLIGLLSQEKTDFSGRYYTLTGARCEPKPVQQPHPPICVGGSGEHRTLRTAAMYAQHWNFVGGPVEEFVRKRDVLREHCADIGRDPSTILLSAHVRAGPKGEPGPAADAAAELREAGLDLAIVYLPPPHRPEALEPLADALDKLR
jgi:alkanesulfonate monooxygenase SsuD/methylene tetrahydromethanopterin reductase-like flavin-dependent oxidoreductase (luciferase family)